MKFKILKLLKMKKIIISYLIFKLMIKNKMNNKWNKKKIFKKSTEKEYILKIFKWKSIKTEKLYY